MFEIFCFLIYRFALAPILIFTLRSFSWALPKKLKQTVLLRDQVEKLPLPSRPILIHAASGEIEYAKPLIRALREHFPQIPIVVSYFSPSALKLFQHIENVDVITPAPWDLRQDVKKFLNFYNPRMVLFARTDIWPEMAYQLRQRKTPTFVFSYVFSPNKKTWISALSRWTLNSLTGIFCVGEKDLAGLQEAGITAPIHALGDTRYDQVFFRLGHSKPLRTQLRPTQDKSVIIAGSTWPEDEKFLFPALGKLLSKSCFALVAPHEFNDTRLKDIENFFLHRGIKVQRYSRAEKWDEGILLLDQMGLLAELYTWGTVAFVGGSFKAKVHSVMEPLAAGLPVVVGPYYQNNREALEFLDHDIDETTFLVRSAENSEALEAHLKKALKGKNRATLKNKIEQHQGATERILQALNIYLR